MFTDSARKRLGQMDAADFFTLLSYFVLAVCAAVDFAPDRKSQDDFKVLFLIVTLNSLHVYFQFWMLARSSAYSRLTAQITGVRDFFSTMLLQICLVAALVFTVQVVYGEWYLLMYLFTFWNIWHVSMQTKGLYYISRLNDLKLAGSSQPLRDLKVLNYYLWVLMAAKATILLFHVHKNLVPEHLLYLGKWDKAVSLALIFPFFGYFAYLAIRSKEISFRSLLILMRFGFPVITVFYPLAGLAVAGLHGVEYYLLTKKIDQSSADRFPVRFVIIFFGVIALQILFDLHSHFGKVPTDSILGFFFTAWTVATSGAHFAYDGFAFRLKDREAREQMLRLIG